MSEQIVFSFFSDPIIGVSFSAWVDERLGDGSFSMDLKRLNNTTLRNFDRKYSDIELKLIRLADELSHKSLLNSFSRKDSSIEHLLSEKGPTFFKTYFRPHIERRLLMIIELCKTNSVPLFFMNSRGFLDSEPLVFSQDNGLAHYRFNWSEKGLLYSLRISIGQKIIDLQQAETIVLTDEPAYLIHHNRLILVDGINGNKLRPFLKKEHILIRQETQKKYFETFVYGLLSRSPVEVLGFSIAESHTVPEAILKLTLDWQNDPVLIPRFRYHTKEIAADYQLSRLVSIDSSHHPPSFGLEHRHKEHEEGAKKLLLKLGLIKKGRSGYLIPHTSDSPIDPALRLVDFMRKNLQTLQSYPFTIRQETDENYNLAPAKLEIKEFNNNDWFDLEIIIKAGDYRIPFKHIRIAILANEKRVVLPDGSYFIIPDEWFGEFAENQDHRMHTGHLSLPAIAVFGEIHGDKVRMHKMHHLGLTQASRSDIRSDSSEELIKRFFSHTGSQQFDKMDILRQYQKAGVQWLYGMHQENHGGILADDMGLGKTVQVLTCLSAVLSSSGKHDNVENTALIIVPVSILHNWENEIRKFTPNLLVYRMTGSNRQNDPQHLSRFDLVLTTYGILRNDIGVLQNYTFNYLVLDESQAIKNARSQVHKAAMQINALHRLAITGTPVENSLTDLWAQFAVVNPGLLGTERWFRKHFLLPEDSRNAEEKQNMLKQIIRPFILRRTKDAVAPDLPPVSYQVLYCDPTDEHRTAYENDKSEVRNFLLDQQKNGASKKTSILILKSLTRLRLMANHPALSMDNYSGDSGKTNEILNRVQQVVENNNKVLLFSQFVKHLDLLAGEFSKNGIRFIQLCGRDDSKTREANIHQFETDDNIRVFLISLKAGGTGLNLTAADYVFLLDPWWNPAVEEQAISRAHRIGQTKPVFVYRFITTGTLEEKIMSLQEKKRETANVFVNKNALSIADVGQVLELLER